MSRNKKIAITIGDAEGIGPEIIIKSLNSLIKGLSVDDFIIIGSQDVLFNTSRQIGLPFPKGIEIIDIPINIKNLEKASPSKESGKHAFLALKKACEMAKKNEIRAITTAPVSKKSLHLAGHFFSGQTEVLKEYLCNSRIKNNSDNVNEVQIINNIKGIIKGITPGFSGEPLLPEMMFVAGQLKVLLLTRHIKVSEICDNLKKENIISSIIALRNSLVKDFKIKEPKIALCGLNPHAGENGLIGREEEYFLQPAMKELINKYEICIEGPFPADTLWAKAAQCYYQGLPLPYDAYVACYHDQGLIPVKMLAMDTAVNTTINLPVIRTSPSHGTAFDIAGQNKAKYQSMVEAIRLSNILSSQKTFITQN